MSIFKTSISLFVVFALIFVSCSSTESVDTKVQKVDLVAVGPLFEGVNTAVVDFDFQEVLPKGKMKSQLDEVILKSVKLSMDTSTLPLPNSFTLSLASPNTSMKECGFLNEPKWNNEGKFEIKLAKEQDFLLEVLQDKNQTLVVDFNLAEDWYDDYSISAELDWEVKLKN